MGLKNTRPAAGGDLPVSAEQRRYAHWLDGFTRIGATLLVAGFAAYLFGWLPAHVPREDLPGLLSLSLADYLAATGTPTGWGWLALVTHGEFASLVGIALLAGGSIACLAVVIPLFARRGDWIYVALCLLEILTLAASASGVFVGTH